MKPLSCCACALVVAAATPATAQPEAVNRPTAARRVVHQFDFEPDAREVFELPRYWDLAQDGSKSTGPRPGFPAWNKAGFDRVAYTGEQSVRLDTQGGSVSVRLEPGVVPVFPKTEYLISARVRTGGLTHARACLVARYLDKANKPIPGASSRSDLVVGAEWLLITARLSDDFADAAYAQVDLEVLQPEQFQHATHDKHQLWPQDFAGSAWFDHVAIVQLPRATLATSSPMNIIRAPERPRVSIALRDLTGEAITGTFTVQDVSGRIVDQKTQGLPGGSWDWEPALAGFGWYRATLELRTNDRRVGSTYMDFAWLPGATGSFEEGGSGGRGTDNDKFSVILRDLPSDRRALLPEILRSMGKGGSVTIPVWSPETIASQADQLSRDLVPIMERLRAIDWRATFSLPNVPDALAAGLPLDQRQPLLALTLDEKAWGPYLIPLLDRFGQSVQHWQIGSVGMPPPRVDQFPAAAARASAVLSNLVPGPVIELPWPADRAVVSTNGVETRLLLSLPEGTEDAGVADLAALWEGLSPSPTFVLDALPDTFSRLDSSIVLAKRAVLLWVANADKASVAPSGLAIEQPWEWTGPSEGPPMPRAELPAWANLADRLRGRRGAGRIERPGVVCIILAPAPGASSRSGALAVWRDSPEFQDASLDLYLGDSPVDLVDIFGNRRSLAPVALGMSGRTGQPGPGRKPPMAHRIPVGDAPLFVERVDVDLARFAASFRLDPAFASSSSNEHELAMVLSNPWRERIEGRITILEPGGLSADGAVRDRSWKVTPRSSTFTMGPAETGRIPFSVAFSPVEEAGPKNFLVEIEVLGTRDYAPIRLQTTLEVGIKDFQVDLSYRIINGASGDIAVEAQVTNRAKESASYELVGFAEGYPRAKVYISELPPGALAIRRFSFPGGAVKLKGQRISVGVEDVATKSRATRSILIE